MNGPEEQRTGAETQTEFEQALTRAMRRVEVPTELSARLLTLAAEAEAKRPSSGLLPQMGKLSNGGRVLAFPKQRAWMSGAIAAVLVLGVLGGDAIHHEHRKAQAQREFETATRITDQALEHTREQLARAGVPLADQ